MRREPAGKHREHATALAGSIDADPSLELIGAGSNFDGLRITVAFSADANLCYGLWTPDDVPVDSDARWLMRLYLINYPDESAAPPESDWTPHVLTIAIIAPESDFDRVLDEGERIVESVEFNPA